MKLAVFDFDSTLMDGETIEFLAREAGVEEEVRNITTRAMNGELDFCESLTKRVSLLKGIREDRVNEICRNLPLMPGAVETVKKLREKDYKVICFSGGFRNATVPMGEKLGLNGEFSNILHVKDSILTGLAGGEMMFNDSKGRMLKKLQKILEITPQDTVAVGDGANDLSMFEHAGCKIAFCAKPVLEQKANIAIKEKNLTKLLEYL